MNKTVNGRQQGNRVAEPVDQVSSEQMVVDVVNQEFINMARRSSGEIKQLRAQIAFLQPKAQAYDALVMVLGMIPRQSQPMGEDLVKVLDSRTAFLERQLQSSANVTNDAAGADVAT